MKFRAYNSVRLIMVVIYTFLSIGLMLSKEFQIGLVAALSALYMYISSLRDLKQVE